MAGIRNTGSAALDLAYVAAGRLDGFWQWKLQPWDCAAGALMVREAGGYVTDITGGSDILKRGDIIAANDKLHAPIERVIGRGIKDSHQSNPCVYDVLFQGILSSLRRGGVQLGGN